MQEEQKIQKSEENEVEVELEEKKDEKVEAQQEAVTEEKKPDELEDYSANVKSRIDKLTRKMREEERQKESAIQFAESVKKENENLKTRLDNLDKGYLEEFNNRVQSQLESAKRALKDANESGDADKIVEAQANLAAITVEKSKITKPKVEKTEEQPNQQPVVPNQPQPIPPQPPQQAQNPKPDPKAEEWAEKDYGIKVGPKLQKITHFKWADNLILVADNWEDMQKMIGERTHTNHTAVLHKI